MQNPDDLLPAGYLEFERDKSIQRYEDDYMICVRNADGSITMTGKPIRSPFYYE